MVKFIIRIKYDRIDTITKCVCGNVISEDVLKEFSSEELQALNDLLDGVITADGIQVLENFIEQRAQS